MSIDIQILKKLYAKAVLNNQEQFMYKGQPILTSYAKYVIEYYETTVANKPQ